MAKQLLALSVVLASVALSYEAALFSNDVDADAQVVESIHRLVSVAAPADLLPAASDHHGGHNDDDESYVHTKASKGDDGYKAFDSWHKKGGDSYGYEKHSAFGSADKGEHGGKHQGGGSYDHSEKSADDHEGGYSEPMVAKATEDDYHYASYEGDSGAHDDGGYDDSGAGYDGEHASEYHSDDY